MSTIRFLSAAEAYAAIPDLCEVLAVCVNGGASVGLMQPYTPAGAEPYWRGVAEAVADGATLLFGAEMDGKIVGTVQVGAAQMPNQPHRGDLKKLLKYSRIG